MSISLIKKESELEMTLDFLSFNMKWSKLKTNTLYRNLINSNKRIGYYGYILRENSNIISGAILIFDQGYICNNGHKLRIINLSSWFVENQFRGYKALLMIEKLVKDHENFIITDLTPTVSVYKILKSFGFQDLQTHNKKFNFISILFNKRIFNYKSIINFGKFTKFISNRKNIFLKSNAEFLSFYINKNERLEIAFIKTKWEKKIGKYYISISGLRILWTSNKILLDKNFYQVLLFLTLKFKSFFITTHCQIKSAKEKKHNLDNHLYKIPKKCKIEPSRLVALGSELEYI